MWKGFKSTLYELAPLTSFQAIAKKKNDAKSKPSKGEKSNLNDKKWLCIICGDAQHSFRRCPLKDQLYSKFQIAYRDGKYRDTQGKEYNLEKGENLASKYLLNFDLNARPHEQRNKGELNSGSN